VRMTGIISCQATDRNNDSDVFGKIKRFCVASSGQKATFTFSQARSDMARPSGKGLGPGSPVDSGPPEVIGRVRYFRHEASWRASNSQSVRIRVVSRQRSEARTPSRDLDSRLCEKTFKGSC
jgi:hypothetical protein